MVDDQSIKDYQSVFPNKIIPDPIRGTVVFQHNETTTFTAEEILAMQFSHAKEQAEAAAQEAIKDVVITVFIFQCIICLKCTIMYCNHRFIRIRCLHIITNLKGKQF